MKVLNIEEYYEQGELTTIFTVIHKGKTEYIRLQKHKAKNIKNEKELIKYISNETSR